MALSSSVVKLLCVAIVAMVLAAPATEALTCGQVSKGLAMCINYLKSDGSQAVPTGCCKGINSLNNAAKSTVDRQAACTCLKSNAKSIKGINLGLAAALPGKCGVNVPYKISPSIDCASVK